MATGFVNISLVPATAVATNGTLTFTYPSPYDAAADFAQTGEKLVVSGLQNVLAQAADTFTLVYGGASVVVTYKDATSIPAGTSVTLQLPVSDYKAVALLTDNSGGTASSTIPAVTGAYVEATMENITASFAAKINELTNRVNTLLALSADGDNVPV